MLTARRLRWQSPSDPVRAYDVNSAGYCPAATAGCVRRTPISASGKLAASFPRTPAPNSGARTLAADQSQSLSVIGVRAHGVPYCRLCLNVWAGHRAGQLAQNNQSGVVLPVGRVINGL